MRRLSVLMAITALVAAACGREEPVRQAEEPEPAQVKVGLLYTVTGEGGEFAQAALGSFGLAVADGEARGLTIEQVDREYGGDPEVAAEMAEELADEGVAGIVVASDDPDLAGALRGFDRVPLVHALLSDDEAVSVDDPTFRVGPSNALQSQKLARFLVGQRGYSKVAVMHDNTAFSRQGADDLERALDRQGADVVMRWEFRVGRDISTPVTYAGQLGAQAMVVWTRDVGEAGRITIEIHRMAQSYQLVLSGNLASFSYGKNASSQVVPTAFRDGILSVGTWAGPWFDGLERMRGFYERFRTENNAVAPAQAVQVYDAALVLAEAAREAGSSDPAAVVQALEGTANFEGAGVPISFSASSHEGVDIDDMAVLAFTKDQGSSGGDLAPDITTGGGFFTINTISVTLPDDLAYLLEGFSA